MISFLIMPLTPALLPWCCVCRLAEVIRDKEEGQHLEELAAGGGKTKKAAKVRAEIRGVVRSWFHFKANILSITHGYKQRAILGTTQPVA